MPLDNSDCPRKWERYWGTWLDTARSLGTLPYKNAELISITIKAEEVCKEMGILERKQSRRATQKSVDYITEQLGNILNLINGPAKLYPQNEEIAKFMEETKKVTAMLEPKSIAPLPRIGYSVENKEDNRAVVLRTVKKVLDLPEKDVFIDIEISFRHTDVFDTQVIGCMTLTKGPQEKATEDGHGPRKKKARHQAVEKKKYKKMAIRKGEKREKEAKMEKAVIRAIPTGEFYAVHNWRPPARAHLSEEENAVYEAGDREDATANDTRSWETGSQHSGPERTLQEKIRDWEDGPLPIEMDDVPAENKKTATQASIARAQPTTPPVEQPKEEKKSVAVKVLTTPKREEPVPQPLPAMAPAEQSKEKKKSSPKKRMSTKSLTVQPKEEKEITPGEVPAPPKKEEVVSHYLHAPLAQLNVEQKPVAVEEPLPPKKTEGVPQYLPAPVEQLKEEKSMPVEVPPKKEETIAQPLPIVVEQPREEKKPAAVEEPAPRQKKEVVSQYLHAPLAQLNVEQKPAAVEEPAPPKKEQLVSQYLPALVEQPKEEKKPVPVEEPAPSKKEEILSKVDVAPVEQLPNTPAAEQPKEEKKLVAAEAQTTPEVPPVPAAGWMEMKAGAKGKTEALLTVRAHK